MKLIKRNKTGGFLDLRLPRQSVTIITEIVSSTFVHGEIYSIQNYLIKFVSDLLHASCFDHE
jgi:hypothetical protein